MGAASIMGMALLTVPASAALGPVQEADFRNIDEPLPIIRVTQAVRRFQIDISPQPLASALEQLNRQTGAQFAYASSFQNIETRGARGFLTVDEALVVLLKGTDAQVSRAGPNTTSIRVAQATTVSTDANLQTIVVEDGRTGAPHADVPSTAEIGNLPPEFPGGQVATGAKVGLLGVRNFMDMPFNLTSYTANTIENDQAQTIGDVLINDPSVRSVYPRSTNTDEFMIRGFTLYNREVAFNGLYGLVPFSSIGLEGIERVEVLKGPNALLNGMALNGSIGGGINLVPKRAGDTPLNRLTTFYISDEQFGAHADMARRYTGDGESVGIRANVIGSGGDTALDNASLDTLGTTLGLDYASDRFRISSDLVYQRRDADAPPQLLFAGGTGPAIEAPDASTNFAQPWTFVDTEEYMGMVRAEFDATSNLTFFAAGGARYGEYDSLQSNYFLQNNQGLIRATPFYNYSEYESTSGEAGFRTRFQTGAVDHRITFSASRVNFDTSTLSGSIPPAVFSNVYRPVGSPSPTIPFSGDAPLVSATQLKSLAVADTLSILDERVQLTIGVRRQEVVVSNYNATTGAITSHYDENEMTPAFGLVVKPLQSVSLYANYIEGLSQGPTAPASAVNAGEVFPPFVSKQAEVGAKFDLGRFGATLSAFQIDQPSSFTDPVTMRFGVDGNQRNRGLELMTFGEISPTIRLLGGVALIDSELTDTAGGVNDGNAGIGVPEVQMNLGGEWDVPFLRGLTLSGRAIYTDAQFLDAANQQEIPDWVRFDVGARYAFEAGGTPMTLRFNVENILDDGYWASASRGGYKAGAPRTFLVSTSFDF